MLSKFVVLTLLASAASRPDLSGNWRLDPSKCEFHSHLPEQLTWRIEQTDETIHLVQQTADRKSAGEIRCPTDGKDCHAKVNGRAETLNFYYNGPVLVELESEGSNRDTVTKKRIQVSSDGATLTVEVIHISPQGKQPEKLVFTK